MQTQIFKVLQQSPTQWVDSQKAEGGKLAKSSIVLQQIGGRFEDSFAATILGPQAQCLFYPGDVVAASLRFTAREYQGQMFQDIVVNEIIKLIK